ncbi:MAG: hypothetical protein K5787_10170 [Lentisphaeria bacterium]|nr:hypothetical protein [Lentisphaeria bacterium]
MKRVLMTLLLAVLGVAVFADDASDTTPKNFSILGESKITTVNNTTYAEYTPYKNLKFTITNTNEAGPLAYQGYFTTTQDVTFRIWQDTDLAVSTASNYDSFTGIADDLIKSGKILNISEYGIYYVDDNGVKSGDYIALSNSSATISNETTIEADKNFGVYYKDGDNYITMTDNWVALDGIYDTNNHFATYGDYDETLYNPLTTEANHNIMTNEPFFCLFQGTDGIGLTHLERQHWESGFLADKPKPTGSPLPGTWTTLAICGLCATAYRKRKNAKH